MIKWIWALLYVLSVLLGNVLVNYYGIISFYGLLFPAGTILIGLSFSTRDFAQRYWGNVQIWIFILISGVITLFLNWQLALASCLAFFVSETVDWGVFTIYKKPFIWRVIVSNLFSTPLDSLIFVTVAFGYSFDPIFGQAIIKYLSGLLILPIIIWRTRNEKQRRISN